MAKKHLILSTGQLNTADRYAHSLLIYESVESLDMWRDKVGERDDVDRVYLLVQPKDYGAQTLAQVDRLNLLIVEDCFSSSQMTFDKTQWYARFVRGPYSDPLSWKTMRYYECERRKEIDASTNESTVPQATQDASLG